MISAGTGHGNADEILGRKKVVPKVVLTVPHDVAVSHILHESDLVATVPGWIAQALAGPFKLAFIRNRAKLPEIAINLFWHGRCPKERLSHGLAR